MPATEGSVSIELSPDGETLRIVLWKGTEPEGLTMFTMPASAVLAASPQEAAALVGARVLAAIGHIAGRQILSLGYGALAEQRRQLTARWHAASLAGDDPDAIFGVGIDKIVESMTSLDATLLDEAERHIKRAAQMGHVAAREFLEVIWPNEKQERLQAIREAKRGGNPAA